MAPLHAHLSMSISKVARQHQLAVVVNTDANACPFIEPSMALDISEEVKLLLSKKTK
jgi:outer membrane protein